MSIFSNEPLSNQGHFANTQPQVANMQTLGTYELDIVGESHYQKELDSICQGNLPQAQV